MRAEENMKLEETTCDDCGEDVYINDAGELFDDEKGNFVHPEDCAEYECANGCGTTVDDEGDVCGDCEEEDDE